MFQAQNRETINSTLKDAVSVKIIMTTSVTNLCFTTQHRTCTTKSKTKTDFLVRDRSCPKIYGLRPHHWYIRAASRNIVGIAQAWTGHCAIVPWPRAVVDEHRRPLAPWNFF